MRGNSTGEGKNHAQRHWVDWIPCSKRMARNSTKTNYKDINLKNAVPGRITRKDIYFLMVIKFCPQRDISMHRLFPAASNYHVVSRFTFALYAVLAQAGRSLFRHYATRRKVTGSIPDVINDIIFTAALGPWGRLSLLTEMSTRNISWG
jgi:hypothetical protein